MSHYINCNILILIDYNILMTICYSLVTVTDVLVHLFYIFMLPFKG